ncbi:MAG: YbgC/FadM family acyl-CoA thioesterase [Pseudomonadota bacterium]
MTAGQDHPTDMSADGTLADGVHRLPIRVYFEDTDATGVVYHANYLRFFERGRSDMTRMAGIDHRVLKDGTGESIVFAVAGCTLKFRAPALLDDRLQVCTRVGKVGGASVDMHQWIERRETRLAEAEIRVAMIDQELRPARFPNEMRQILQTLCQKANEQAAL